MGPVTKDVDYGVRRVQDARLRGESYIGKHLPVSEMYDWTHRGR